MHSKSDVCSSPAVQPRVALTEVQMMMVDAIVRIPSNPGRSTADEQ